MSREFDIKHICKYMYLVESSVYGLELECQGSLI